MRALATLRSHTVTLLVTIGAVAAVVAAAVVATGSGPPSVSFREPGHWVYNRIDGAAFHVDAGTRRVDARVDVPSSAGDPLAVLQGHRQGFVVAREAVSPFARAALAVGAPAPTGARRDPGRRRGRRGGPDLVYPQAGTIVRLGEPPTSVEVGGPVGTPVHTADGTVWVHRPDTGEVCALRSGAVTLDCAASTAPKRRRGTDRRRRSAGVARQHRRHADDRRGRSGRHRHGPGPAPCWSGRPTDRAGFPSSSPAAAHSSSPTPAGARRSSSISARAATPFPPPSGASSPSSISTGAGCGRSTRPAHRCAPSTSRPARRARSAGGRPPVCRRPAGHGHDRRRARRVGHHGHHRRHVVRGRRPGCRGGLRRRRTCRHGPRRRAGRRPPGADGRRGQAPGRRAHRLVARHGRRRRPLHRGARPRRRDDHDRHVRDAAQHGGPPGAGRGVGDQRRRHRPAVGGRDRVGRRRPAPPRPSGSRSPCTPGCSRRSRRRGRHRTSAAVTWCATRSAWISATGVPDDPDDHRDVAAPGHRRTVRRPVHGVRPRRHPHAGRSAAHRAAHDGNVGHSGPGAAAPSGWPWAGERRRRRHDHGHRDRRRRGDRAVRAERRGRDPLVGHLRRPRPHADRRRRARHSRPPTPWC